MRFFGFRGVPKKHHSFPFFFPRTFPVQNRNLPDFSGVFQAFPSEKWDVTNEAFCFLLFFDKKTKQTKIKFFFAFYFSKNSFFTTMPV